MRVAITGVSGYLGAQLAKRLARESGIDSICGFDLRAPSFAEPKLEFVQGDIRDGSVARVVQGCDVAVHLAFVVQEIRDKRAAWDINVVGSCRFLEACAAAKVRKVVVASSIAAYGSNPGGAALDESAPLRGGRSYYAETKRVLEALLDEFQHAHPETVVSRARPSIICGACQPPFFKEILRNKVVRYVRGNPSLPLVHEDDVVEIFRRLVLEDHPGAFNVDAGNLPFQELGRIFGYPVIGVPYPVAKLTAAVGYRLGVLPYSEHWVELARHPMVIDTSRARRELGWQPTKTPEQAVREMAQGPGGHS